ncbi:hypothetical protein ACKAV7_013910 [Fusarium commune]
MLTGFEALGAASAVLQVISFATDITVACKKAYDGVTTSDDDLHRHAKQMSEAVDRVKSRCGQMTNTNASFSTPELKTISQDFSDAAKELEAQVSYVTSLQAKGDIGKTLRKALRTFRRKKKLEDLEKSLFRYKQLIDIELKSHLCSRSEAARLQQESAFQKLDTDVQSLVNQLAQGVTDVQNLVKHEHATIRSVVTRETTRAEVAINSHTNSQVLKLRTTAETKRKCEVFLQSLKAPRMNQRYNDVMDSRDASFNQVFATYEDMIDMYYGDSEESGHSRDDDDSEHDADAGDASGDSGDVDSESYESSEAASYSHYLGCIDGIYRSWDSFNMWLQSDEKLFYIQGKPGSGKSTLIKFILDQDQTHNLVQRWSPNAIVISYFFWKIGSEEQNSIKGLWCSLLYKRLQDQQHLILSTLQHFNHLSLHAGYHDWSIKDLQAVWDHVANLDKRHICIFIDGLDEIQDKDGFSELAKSIKFILRLPRTKLCVSTRPEAQIMRWIESTNAAGILLEELTRFDMIVFVRQRFRQLSPNSHLCQGCYERLGRELVDKAQGVFLWLHLATRSIIEGIENEDSEDMISARLDELPGDLEKLYIDMWERLNAKSTVYREAARRYFRYILHGSMDEIQIEVSLDWIGFFLPLTLEIACAEEREIQERLLMGRGTIRATEIIRICNETKASIHIRCAGLLEVQPLDLSKLNYDKLGHNITAFGEAFGKVRFIHRTAHDFLTDTEAGQGILGCESLSDYPWQARLLKGLICMVIVLVTEWDVPCRSDDIIEQITNFAKRWGREGLQLATEMLNIVRPFFDEHFVMSEKNFLTSGLNRRMPQRPFLSHLASDSLYDDYVISCLKDGCSAHLATSIMREGWCPGADVKLPKRTFDALIVLGADPHKYGVLGGSSETMPFVREATAFTNFLMSFLMSTKRGIECQETRLFETRKDEPITKAACEILEMAIHMANTCQNLNAVVSLFSFIHGTGPMMIVPFGEVIDGLREPTSHHVSMFYEVNIQFLLLYLLSKIGGNLADCALAAPQAQDVLSRIDSPLVKIRYFQLPLTKKDKLEQNISSQRTFQRILSPEPLLRRDIEQLFDVDFEGLSQDLCMPHEDRTDLYTITQYIKDVETEEVNVEDMMTSLAAENLGFCTYEEAGITPPYEYLRNARERNHREWGSFPLAMGRLEAAAAIKEGIGGHE